MPAHVNTAPSSAPARGSDGVEVARLPMSPKHSADFGKTDKNYSAKMKAMRCCTGTRNIPVAPRRRDLLWASQMPPTSSLARLWRDFNTRTAAHDTDGSQFTTLTESHRLQVRVVDLRELILGATLLLQGDAELLVWLREMWEEYYGACRDPACCLSYNVFDPSFTHPGICRHWEYWSKRQVYLDNFTSVHDYLLAQALRTHKDAVDTINQSGLDMSGRCKYVKIEVGSYGMMSEMTNHWPDGVHTTSVKQVRPLFGVLTAILPTQSNTSVSCDELLRSWDYGQLYHGRGGTKTAMAWGFAVSVNRTWVLIVDLSLRDLEKHVGELYWRPEKNEATYIRRFQTIERFARQNPPWPLMEAIWTRQERLQDRSPREQRQALGTGEFARVKVTADKDQLQVIERALTQTGVILARGPYGCGKTTLIALLVHVFMAAYCGDKHQKTNKTNKTRIAIVSETNAAVDADQARLIDLQYVKPGQVLRLGKPGNQTPDAHKPYYLSYIRDQARASHDAKDRSIRQCVWRAEKEALENATVVIGTLAQFGKERFDRVEFELVVNDEAAQTLECSLLQALRASAKVLVVIGDTKQLTAYLPAGERERNYYRRGGRRHKMEWSLMHSMTHAYQQQTGTAGVPGLTMEAEFRSHPRITQFLAPFYDYKLRDRAHVSSNYLANMMLPLVRAGASWCEKKRLGRIESSIPADERVVWISPSNSIAECQRDRTKRGAHMKSPDARNLRNQVEVTAVLELLLRIRRCLKEGREQARGARAQREERTGVDEEEQDEEGEPPPKSVLVISPYNAQVSSAQQLLTLYARLWMPYLTNVTFTTDSSQGREADITIVSMVRNQTLGFLDGKPARALVSLSRSRDYLFILADHSTFGIDDTWRMLMENADTMGLPCYLLEWTTESATERLTDERELMYITGADDEDEDEDEDMWLED